MNWDNISAPPFSEESLQKAINEIAKRLKGGGERLFIEPTHYYIRPLWISEEDFKEFLSGL